MFEKLIDFSFKFFFHNIICYQRYSDKFSLKGNLNNKKKNLAMSMCMTVVSF